MPTTTRIILATFTLLGCLAGSAAAQCNSIPIAVDDFVDYFGRPISVEPMLNDREPDGEALQLTVTSDTCSSPAVGSPISVSVDNGTVRLVPTQLGTSTICTIDYRIEDEHGFTDDAQMTLQINTFFADGFETGNTTGWDQTLSFGGGVEP